MAGLVDARMEEVKGELLGLFRTQLDAMLVEIANEYDIDLEELQEKYEIFSDPKTPPAPKAAAKKRAPKDEERVKCAAKTAKGSACKNFALAGSTFCACHGKTKGTKPPTRNLRAKASKGGVKPVSAPSSDSENEIDSDAESVKSPPKTKAYKRPGKKPVVHDHPMDKEVHEECEACEVIGNGETGESSVVVDPDVMKVLDELFESESESESETE